MYLVHDKELNCQVFLDDDPRSGGFEGPVIEGVSLEDDELEGPVWNHGDTRPEQLLAVAESDPKNFKVFKNDVEMKTAGYRAVGANYAYDTTWTHYLSATGRA